MIYFISNKTQELNSIDELYCKYNKKEFKSPFRSTIPLILLFKNNILQDLELLKSVDKDNLNYIFEYETPVCKGKGKASCTDLMIENNDLGIAIEAKRTEDKYETVEKWLSKGNKENKKEVLCGWLELIEKHLDIKIDSKNIEKLPYQLIHRVASACSLSRKQTSVIYIGFDLKPKMKEYYLKCLNDISSILNNKLDFYLITYGIQKSERQIELESLWKGGSRDLSKDILKGLKSNNLIDDFTMQYEKINH